MGAADDLLLGAIRRLWNAKGRKRYLTRPLAGLIVTVVVGAFLGGAVVVIRAALKENDSATVTASVPSAAPIPPSEGSVAITAVPTLTRPHEAPPVVPPSKPTVSATHPPTVPLPPLASAPVAPVPPVGIGTINGQVQIGNGNVQNNGAP